MKTRTAILPLVLLGALAVAACRGGNGAPEEEAVLCPSKTPAAVESDGELGLQEVYDRMAEAIRCPGYALHVTFSFPGPPFNATGSSQAWIDLEGNRARKESEIKLTLDGEEFEQWSKEIILAELTYRGGSSESPRGLRALACHGSDSAAFSVLLDCQGYLENSTTAVEIGASFNGKSALALVTEGYTGSREFTARLYVDDSTFLPLGVDIEFVSLDSLPADFFDPASIGYVEKNPEEPLETTDVRVPVYWLGREFDGGDGFPALTLSQVFAPTPDQAPPFGYSAEITYRRADDEFGWGMVSLQLYAREGWEAFLAQSRGGNWWDGPCIQRRELDLPDRRAVIYSGYEDRIFVQPDARGDCPPRDKFVAHVYVGDAFVKIDAPGLQSTEYFESDYDSEEAMELLVRSLVLRE